MDQYREISRFFCIIHGYLTIMVNFTILNLYGPERSTYTKVIELRERYYRAPPEKESLLKIISEAGNSGAGVITPTPSRTSMLTRRDGKDSSD